MKQYLKFEYFYIFIVLIWLPFQKFILKIDGASRSIFILTILIVAYYLKNKEFYKTAFRKPLLIWGVWVIYAFFNWKFKALNKEVPDDSFLMLLFVPYVLMILISLCMKRKFNIVLNILIVAMYIDVIIIRLFDNQSFQGRIGGEINSNTTGLVALVLLMFLYLKYVYKKISSKNLILLSIIPISTLILSGSKTAFGGFFFLIITHFVINRSKQLSINVVKLISFVLVLSLPLYFILNYTLLGKRLLNTTNETEEINIDTGNPILNKFGDRGIFYYLGWKMFEENPITGIGLENYKYFADTVEEQHSEYMIQLSELGIIGFILFIWFYGNIFKRLIKLKLNPKEKKYKEIYLAYLIIILLIITATRMYKVWYLFSVIGVVIAFIMKEEASIKKNKKIFKIKYALETERFSINRNKE